MKFVNLIDLTPGSTIGGKAIINIEQLNTKADSTDLTTHTSATNNPHGVTKLQVGLGNVEDKSSATIRGEITSANVTSALGYTPEASFTKNDAFNKNFGTTSGTVAQGNHNHDAIYVGKTGDQSMSGSLTIGSYTKIQSTTGLVAGNDSIVLNLQGTDWGELRMVDTKGLLLRNSTDGGSTWPTEILKAYKDNTFQFMGNDIYHSGNFTPSDYSLATHNHDTDYEPKNSNIQSHISSTSNPHGVTKAQVGLGSVANYGVATQTEAQTGTATNKYMTPLRVKEAIASLESVASVAGKTGTVTLTNADVGLGNVENKSSATIRSEITSSNVTTALGFTPESAFTKNTAFNKNFGTTAGTVSEGDHIHSYLPLSGGTMTGAITLTKGDGTSGDIGRIYGGVDNNDYIEIDGGAGDYIAFVINGNEMGRFTASGLSGVGPSEVGAEPAFTKNTAFNKNLGTTAGTVAEGNHNHDTAYEPKNSNIQSHISSSSNPHGVTKAQVGLGSVENKSSATIRGEITSSNVTTALGFIPEQSFIKNNAFNKSFGTTSGTVAQGNDSRFHTHSNSSNLNSINQDLATSDTVQFTNVGVGTSSPNEAVDVQGSVRIREENSLKFGGTGASDAAFSMSYNATTKSVDFNFA